MLRSLLFAALLAGCTGEATYSGAAYYGDPTPSLVEVSPGVQVIADYDYPVFYSDGFYWRYDGGIWYRSHSYRNGWGRVNDVPVAVRSIDRPQAYVHFRGNARAGNEPVRDHRSFERQPEPVVRDHREPVREERPPVREERPAPPPHEERPAPAREAHPNVPAREEHPRPAPARDDKRDKHDHH